MNQPIQLPNHKVTVSRLGMRIIDPLTPEEWQELAAGIGGMATSIAFIVGDWLVYGQTLFGTDGFPDKKVDSPSYQLAIKATGLDMSTRRLRKSLNLGRVATDADLEPDPADKGQLNYIPFVNRICCWWRRLQAERFLSNATKAQREVICRDLEPIINIYNQLKQ